MSSHISPPPVSAPTVPWPLVAVLILGVGVLTSAALAWSLTLLIIGAALVLGALAGAAALTRVRTDR